MRIRAVCAMAAALVCTQAVPASAALTSFQSYVGAYGVSTDGWGSVTGTGTISAQVPAGATVVAAYLYTSTYGNGSLFGVGGTLAGSAVSYASLGTNSDACCSLTAARANVTSIVKPLIDGGPGGVYNFAITESSATQDGSALVVIYSDASLPKSTVGILDGFALVSGDTTSINFSEALDPAQPGFFAEMRLGIGFSFDGSGCTGSGQTSVVAVNGTTITENSGCNDDSADAFASDGNLITAGGFDDEFSPFLPGVVDDTERYDLVPWITAGDTSIVVRTSNASRNDNIFLAAFYVLGEAGINEPPPVPEPTALSLLALGALALMRRRHHR